MPQTNDFSEVRFLSGNARTVAKMVHTPSLPVFSDKVIEFLVSLSKRLVKADRTYPDVISLGFWCRKASILDMAENYVGNKLRFGKGIAFHISPSNVAVNFAYSLISGLLAGCKNIVRLPSKNFRQTDMIVNEINDLLINDYTDLAEYICLVRYPSDCGATDTFSSICDERIIWGGNKTIAAVRKSPLKPRAGEITFADRVSAVLIDADRYIANYHADEIAEKFWNDTFLTDQNACTSPIIVVWTGSEIDRAKSLFWTDFEKTAAKKYGIGGAQAVGKLHAAYKAAIAFENVKIQNTGGNLITRVHIDKIPANLSGYKYNSGFFYETEVKSLDEIIPLCGEELQTLTYLGFEPNEIIQWLSKTVPIGIDRAVPIGSSMDFSLIWDGYDLISEMSRIKNVQ